MFSFLKRPPAGNEAASGWLQRLANSLARTGGQLSALLVPGKRIDEALYEELETLLLISDVGMEATQWLLAEVRHQVKEQRLSEGGQLKEALACALLKLLHPLARPLDVSSHRPFVILLCGVNGAGKTTSIGKLAHYFRHQGRTVLLAAGDTFRAAAREQLLEWGRRNDVTVVSQQNGDPAAVIYDAVQSARARGVDMVLADTAGRLTTQAHLMEELKKVKRVIGKALPGAPHEVLLVLDANTGQNALSQVKAFGEALGVSGLLLTKLDGTAKGGILAAIARTHPIPVRFIGIGEGLDDLKPFVAEEFVAALLGETA